MRRREFITLLSSAAAWPLAADAQGPSLPVIKERALAAVIAPSTNTIGAIYAKAKLVKPLLDDDEAGRS